jgi:hypothetical protein
MNKYLLMSAAAVLGAVSAATAAVDKKVNSGVQSVYLSASASGSAMSFCDVVTITWKGANDEILDQESGCGSSYTGVFGAGNAINGKTKVVGQNSDASDSIEDSNLAQLNLDFVTTSTGAPINGGAFTAYATLVTTSGALDSFEYYAGHYYFRKSKQMAGHHPAISARLAQAARVRTPVVSGLSVKK